MSIDVETLDGKSLSIAEEKMSRLRTLFPEAVCEGRIDFNQLKAALGEAVYTGEERYGISWVGKHEAFKEVQKQTTATLVPDRTASVDFDASQNIFIEGENLEVLRILQKAYYGKIKMIYIDPPYNTGNDSFVYPDDYAERRDEYEKRAGIRSECGLINKQDLWRKNTKENGQFHSVWLSMMYPRLYLARNLLREDGVIFVSIDDSEQANLKLLMDEVFGQENFIAQLIWEKGRKNDAKLFSVGHEYILVYSKNRCYLKDNGIIWREAKPGADEIQAEYLRLREKYGTNNKAVEEGIRLFYENLPKSHPSKKHSRYCHVDDKGIWRDDNISWPGSGGPSYDIIHPITGKPCAIPEGGWRYSTPEKMNEMIRIGKVVFRDDHTDPPLRKTYLVRSNGDDDEIEEEDVGIQVAGSYFYRSALQASNELTTQFRKKVFDNPKDHEVLSRWISYIGNPGKDDLILDFFAGSCTTAQAVIDLNQKDGGNRHFICIQIPEPTEKKSEAYKAGYRTIADIGRARICKVIEKIKNGKNDDLALEDGAQDLGFKSYKLQYSNFKVWRSDLKGKEAILKQLEAFRDPLAEGVADDHEAIVTEVLLKAGFPLSTTVARHDTGDGAVFNIENGRLWVALDRITPMLIAAAIEAKPQTFMCLSTLFQGEYADQTLMNTVLELKEAGIEIKMI